MKENNIEEDIKIVENYLEHSAINETDSDFFKNGGWETVDLEIPKSMQHILSDYKRVLKENEELKEDRDKFKKALGRRITYCNELEKDLFENGSNYVIPKQIVKDKIEEYDKQRIKMEKDDIGVGFTLGKEWSDLKAKIEALQDLLERSREYVFKRFN